MLFSWSSEGEAGSAGLKPVPGQAGPLLPRVGCSGELVERQRLLSVGQTFLCLLQE